MICLKISNLILNRNVILQVHHAEDLVGIKLLAGLCAIRSLTPEKTF